MTIIFYDIPSRLPGGAWSPNTWKTRYYLNYRCIPYRTEWIEYPDIKQFSLLHAIPPTSVPSQSSGQQPRYTLPAIHDPSTGIYIADSLAIAEYLDEKYPEDVTQTPGGFPKGTLGLHRAFNAAFDKLVVSHSMFVIPAIAPWLNPASEEFFKKTRQQAFKVEVLEDAIPKGEQAEVKWAKFQVELDKVAQWYPSNEKGAFIMGDKPTWADIVVASELIWMKIVLGAESEKWKDVASWHNGRWKNILESMDPFAGTTSSLGQCNGKRSNL